MHCLDCDPDRMHKMALFQWFEVVYDQALSEKGVDSVLECVRLGGGKHVAELSNSFLPLITAS